MPKPTKFPLDELYKLFEKHEKIIVTNGKVLRPADDFWKKFKDDNNIGSSKKGIYNDALKWLKGREQKKKKTLVTSKRINDNIVTSDSEFQQESSESSEWVSSVSESSENEIKFSIKLTYNLWSLIEPELRSCKDKSHKSGVRQYLALKPGLWSSVFVEKLAEHKEDIICDWSFDSAKVTPDGEYYVRINADCINCKAQFFAFLDKKPIQNEELVFKCIVKNFNEAGHLNGNKRVRVSKSQAKELATSKKPAVVLHRELASKSGQMFQRAKGRVPSSNAIRIMQSRNRGKERISPDTFVALKYLKKSSKYAQTIHSIGFSPFSVIYGSSNQFLLYNMYQKKNSITRISGDATGSVVRKIGMFMKVVPG